MSLTALPGNPQALTASLGALDKASTLIQQASETLRHVAVDGRGETMTALRESSTSLAVRLDDAHQRYAGTAAALRVYSVELAAAHVKANQAVEADRDGLTRLHIAQQKLDDADLILRQAEMNGGPQVVLDEAIRDHNNAQWLYNNATSEIHDALVHYNAAEHQMNEAAERAIASIISAFDTTNDSVMDRVGALLSSVADFAKALTRWIGEVLKATLDLIGTVVKLVAEALLLVAVAVLILAVINVLVVVALVLVAQLLIGLVVAFRLWELTELLGIDDLTQLRMVALAISIACPLLGGFIAAELLAEVMKPTPEVRRVDDVDDLNPATPEEAAHYAVLERMAPPDSIDDLMRTETMLDPSGAKDQTVVDFQKITDEDGTVRWIITLPSTQDWNLGSDPGAVNDLGGNLTMMLLPEVQTQYERAVLEAMKQAGVQSDDQVMLVGFSQGGILAGLMAQKYANGGNMSHGGYNITDIVAAGSPIEGFSIPDSVHVISTEHTWDPVHQLDMHAGPAPDNFETVTGGDQWIKPGDAHFAAHYTETLLNADEASGGALTREVSEFLTGDANATLPSGSPAYEHFDYAFSE